jgi:hypothetical protein
VLKDLIVSGDATLLQALDRFAEGDRSELETYIKSGVLDTPPSLDLLLDDLDLNVLTMGVASGLLDVDAEVDEHYQGDLDDLSFEASFVDEDPMFEPGSAGSVGPLSPTNSSDLPRSLSAFLCFKECDADEGALAGSLGEIARSPLGWGLDFEYSGFEEDSSIPLSPGRHLGSP